MQDRVEALIQDNDILIEQNATLIEEVNRRDALLENILQVAFGHGDVKEKYKGSYRGEQAGSKLANVIHQIRQFQHTGELDLSHREVK